MCWMHGVGGVMVVRLVGVRQAVRLNWYCSFGVWCSHCRVWWHQHHVGDNTWCVDKLAQSLTVFLLLTSSVVAGSSGDKGRAGFLHICIARAAIAW